MIIHLSSIISQQTHGLAETGAYPFWSYSSVSLDWRGMLFLQPMATEYLPENECTMVLFVSTYIGRIRLGTLLEDIAIAKT